ncbi:MAG: oligosaccharide flippase family protein [Lactobacillaceae bacterium]|jgi:O-antigen/teichoic acid export membrane protein|nr:oligosaccharide flippase family protein [Lactobacillaceae bacterium]
MKNDESSVYRGELSMDDLQALLNGTALNDLNVTPSDEPRPVRPTHSVVPTPKLPVEKPQPQPTEVQQEIAAEQVKDSELDAKLDQIVEQEIDEETNGITVTEVNDTYDYANHRVKPEEKKTFVVSEEALTNQAERQAIQGKLEEANAHSRMLRGSMWMTLGSLASRFLGALYIIPWTMMIGLMYTTSANSLYAQGYQIYAVFLLIATAGLPNVLARLVAEYSAKQQFGRVKRVFQQSMLLGGAMGIAAAGVLYMCAGVLSQGDPNVVPVLQSLAAAVLIIPILSMLRGYVQGFEFMDLSAISQFIEQVVRVGYMLSMTAWIMLGHNGDWVDAVVESTFAAFWGALAGIIVLLVGIWLRRGYFESQYVLTGNDFSKGDSVLLRMAKQSLPIILAGSAISLVQVFDQYTFFHIMKAFTNVSATAVQDMFAQFAFNSNKLVMLTVSLAVGMAETALPMLAKANAVGNRQNIGAQISYAFRLLAFVMVPATLGMAAVARPLYILFYGNTDVVNGTLILQFASYVGIAFGLYMVVLAIYQGLGQLKFTLYILAIVLVVKAVLQVPLTLWLSGMGPLVSTMLGFVVALGFAVYRLVKRYPANWSRFMFSFTTILIWSIVMYAVVAPVVYTTGLFVNDNRVTQLVLLFLGVIIGGLVYGVATLKTHLGGEILGDRITRIANKLPF